jgi:hypothetical protein
MRRIHVWFMIKGVSYKAMLLVLLLALASIIKCLLAIVIVPMISSGYTAYMSVTRARVSEHLRHYHLHLLEKSLKA